MINEQSANQDGVLFSINVPGQSLSFSQYLWGAKLVRLSLPEGRRRLGRIPTFLIATLVMWLIFAFTASLSDGQYKFLLLARTLNQVDGEYLFKLRNSAVISVFLGCYITGVVTIRLLYRLHQRRWFRKFYDANDAIQSGYCLQLMAQGVRWMDSDKQTFRAFVAWNKVRGVENHNDMDYLDLGTLGFLWIPTNLAEYPRAQVRAFIKQH